MGHILPYGGQVPLASAFASVGAALETTTFATSVSSFSVAPQASSGLAPFSDIPPEVLASEFLLRSSTATESITTYPSDDAIARSPSVNSDIVVVSDTTNTSCNTLMKNPGRKGFGGVLASGLGYVSLTGLGAFMGAGANPSESLENAEWIASGTYSH